MMDFIIAAAAIAAVAWAVVRMIKRRKSSCINKCLCGLDCELCEKKVR